MRNTNAQTEHSKALRAKTSAQWKKKRIASGEMKAIQMTLKKADFEAMQELQKKLNLSRPALLNFLVAFYNEHH